MTSILLFEDAAVAGLGPPAHTRPAYELRVGALNLRERLQLAAPGVALHARVREPLRAVLAEAGCGVDGSDPGPGPAVLLNARWDGTVSELRGLLDALEGSESSFAAGGALAAARVDAADLASTLAGAAAGRPLAFGSLLDHPWQAVHRNPGRIADDAAVLSGADLPRGLFGVVFGEGATLPAWLERGTLRPLPANPDVQVAGDHAVRVGEGVDLRPGVVVDATGGPVVIGAGTRIGANSVVEGPAYLGPGCAVNPGAKLREGTSLGAGCKVGGEVEESIVLDLSNKQHDGFLGHAFLGSWVNLGADTNASDLKNNYGPVRVDLDGTRVDTGERFVGPTIGDHAKTGINTMLSTGAVLGVSANVFGGGFPPATLPAFTWGGAGSLTGYDLAKALATAEVVMGRRGVRFTAAQSALLRAIHAQTRAHRDAVLAG